VQSTISQQGGDGPNVAISVIVFLFLATLLLPSGCCCLFKKYSILMQLCAKGKVAEQTMPMPLFKFKFKVCAASLAADSMFFFIF